MKRTQLPANTSRLGENCAQQECIPVGCVLPAAVAVTGGRGGLHTPLGADPPEQIPLEQAPPWEQTPPPPEQSPLGAGTLLGVGLETPQARSPSTSPWLWAWRPLLWPDPPQVPPGC